MGKLFIITTFFAGYFLVVDFTAGNQVFIFTVKSIIKNILA